jgi:DNA modification methylase
LKTLHEAKYPETKHGAVGRGGRKDDNLSSFSEDTASKTGQSARTIERETRIGAKLPQEIRDAVRDSDVADNQSALLALTTIKDLHEQRSCAEMLLTGEAKNVHQARRRYAEEQRASLPAPEDPDCRIVTGDCVEQLLALDQSPHLLITDPPYGLEVHNTRRGGQDYADGEDYAIDLLRRLLVAAVQKLAADAHLYVFSGYTHAARVKALLAEFFDVQDNPIVWAKDNHTMCDFAQWYPSKHEYIWFAKQRQAGRSRRLAACVPDVISCARARESTHSAEKPVALLAQLIEQSTLPGEFVIDPFCGSGSAGVAAKSLSRAFVGIELDPKWAEVARGRVAG